MKAFRMLSVLTSVIILAVCLIACSSGPASSSESGIQSSGSDVSGATSDEMTGKNDPGLTFSGQGNSSGNIINGGFLALDDGWIYYNSVYDDFCLYKIRADGSEKTKICDDYAWCINTVGDWLYYRDKNTDFSLIRIKKDGTSREQLLDYAVADVTVVDDYIYFVKGVLGSVCRTRLDGTDFMELSDDSCGNLYYENGKLYYINYFENQSIFCIATDGSGRTKISGEEVEFFAIIGSDIFYGNDDDENMYRINLQGGTAELVTEGGNTFRTLNVLDNQIFYPLGWFYRIDSDGSNKIQVSEDKRVTRVHILDDMIYYYISETDSYARISADGSVNEPYG